MDKAVFSFWNTSGDALVKATNWANPKFQLYSWTLAVNNAARFFSEVELVTDSDSLPIFEKLNLPFTNIKTDLDSLSHYPKSLWALGKIKAYSIQHKPFIHLDNDFICFSKPGDYILNSEIGFQNLENGAWFDRQYRKHFENINEKGKTLPPSWNNREEAFNFGIYVCNNLNYNNRYCKESFQLVDNNMDIIISSGHPGLYCVLFEQYIGATVAKAMGIKPKFLSKYCINSEIEKQGLIHIWGSKRDLKWFNNLEKIVKTEYPKQFDIINNVLC